MTYAPTKKSTRDLCPRFGVAPRLGYRLPLFDVVPRVRVRGSYASVWPLKLVKDTHALVWSLELGLTTPMPVRTGKSLPDVGRASGVGSRVCSTVNYMAKQPVTRCSR